MRGFFKRIRSLHERRRSISIFNNTRSSSSSNSSSSNSTQYASQLADDSPPRYCNNHNEEPVAVEGPSRSTTPPTNSSAPNNPWPITCHNKSTGEKQTFKNEYEYLRSNQTTNVPIKPLMETAPWYHLSSKSPPTHTNSENLNAISVVGGAAPCGCLTHIQIDNNEETKTSAESAEETRARLLAELDKIYPEKKKDYRFFQQDGIYQFTLRRRCRGEDGRSSSGNSMFEIRSESFGKCRKHANANAKDDNGSGLSSASSGVGDVNVHGRDFRLFERLARGNASLIATSFLNFYLNGYTFDDWAQDEKNKEVIFPCFQSLRDAAGCMAEILQAAIAAYDTGHPGCLWALIHQNGIFSDNDPSFKESLSLLREWTKSEKHNSSPGHQKPVKTTKDIHSSSINLGDFGNAMRAYLRVL